MRTLRTKRLPSERPRVLQVIRRQRATQDGRRRRVALHMRYSSGINPRPGYFWFTVLHSGTKSLNSDPREGPAVAWRGRRAGWRIGSCAGVERAIQERRVHGGFPGRTAWLVEAVCLQKRRQTPTEMPICTHTACGGRDREEG
ncbi:hypothetical protein Q8A67_021131 [Cirrhinus molitorella]|uniref:Uncharacterized protein n=1 Tax=Cirrhinus molitorella TaxID=172907 RepID=A0AA88P598_9TELE|nr:hypothetical protein Q8A67_021131 [Cirrhinus molitorella]